MGGKEVVTAFPDTCNLPLLSLLKFHPPMTPPVHCPHWSRPGTASRHSVDFLILGGPGWHPRSAAPPAVWPRQSPVTSLSVRLLVCEAERANLTPHRRWWMPTAPSSLQGREWVRGVRGQKHQSSALPSYFLPSPPDPRHRAVGLASEDTRGTSQTPASGLLWPLRKRLPTGDCDVGPKGKGVGAILGPGADDAE